MMMTFTERKRMREQVMKTDNKVYNTKKYQYWINGNGELCRARLDELDTVDCEIEVLD